MTDRRLPQVEGELIDRDRPLRFSFDGDPVDAYEGDTVASALFAAGQRVFSRSFKYHRRRGLMCCAGQCPNCMVRVDDEPAVPACTTPAREGMRVEHINAWPSLEHDVMEAGDRAGGPMLQVGFYYKTFLRPRRLWPLYERVLRSAAGLGHVDPAHRRTRRFDKVHVHADVLVVGGGRSGLRAAIDAAHGGADVLLVDEGLRLGGRLARSGPDGAARADGLVTAAHDAGVRVLAPAYAGGLYEGLLVPVYQDDTMHRVRADEVVLATGCIEQPLVFAGNDLPGVMLAGGVQRLINQFRLVPGRRAVVVAAGGEAADAVRALEAAGVDVALVTDPTAPDGLRPLKAHGRKAVQAVTLASASGERRRVECDLLVVAGGRIVDAALLRQAGGTLAYDADRRVYVPDRLPPGVRLALDSEPATPDVPVKAKDESGRQFVCFCEDVTTKDVAMAAGEGFDSLELSKRYTTVTMGPCQGRMCHRNSGLVLAAETGVQPDAQTIGLTTARPPHSPTRFGVLAGRGWHPVKRTPLHDWNAAHSDSMAWAGDWMRAYDYGDAEAEVATVHDSLGVIDVSPLGKLIVRGPDAAELLERLYPNRYANLAEGRVRYGVVCGEDGAILDDGTIARLDDDTFYVTTTSSGSGGMEEWFTWWNAVWGLDVELTNVTPALGAINLAGPASREALSTLTDLDVSNDAFPYLGARHATVAGVPCLILRIGFVGELGYEIHHPAAASHGLWERLIDAGASHGVRPFGLEPQRRLRLEKLHVIVGQDTDAESNPLEAAMPWIVKLDKDQDFIGRRALEQVSGRGDREVLVGWTGSNGAVPAEGAQVVGAGGQPAGRVTSARFSPRLGRAIGMAWVPATRSDDGTAIEFSHAGGPPIPATITHQAFHDPDGELLRS
jgi:sarcosine oxidase subunit alpha